MEHQRCVVGLGVSRNVRVQRCYPSECKESCCSRMPGTHCNDLEAVRMRNSPNRGVHVSLDHQRLHAQLGQIKSEFMSAINGIERHACCASGHSEASHGHLWAIWKDQGHAIMVPQPDGLKCS